MSNEQSPVSLIDRSKGGLPAIVWSDEEEVMSRAAFTALDSKKQAKLPKEREALAAFGGVKPTTTFLKLMLDDGSPAVKAFEDVKVSGKKTEAMRNQNWT
jgi:hypothetical protein